MIEKYDGHIVRFVSDEDELDADVRNHLYETAGEKIVLKMEKPFNEWFLISGTQAIILAELNKVKGYQDENNKSLKSVRKQTRHRLHKVETLRANWIQTTVDHSLPTTIIRSFNSTNHCRRLKSISE